MIVKLLRHCGVLLLLLWCAPFGRFYTLNELVEETVKNSIILKTAKKEIDHTETKIQKRYSRFFPVMSSTFYLTHLIDNSVAENMLFGNDDGVGFMYLNGTDQNDVPVDSENAGDGSGNTLTVREYITPFIEIRQPVFSRGKNFLSLKSENTLQHINVCKYEELKQQEILKTKKHYFKVLVAQEYIKLMKSHLLLLKENHRLKCLGAKQGEVEIVDTLKTALEVKKGVLNLFEAESRKKNALESLVTQSGIPDLPDALWFDDKLPEPVFFITIEEAVTQMYEKNSALRQLNGYETIHKNHLLIQKLEYLPEVNVGAAYGLTIPVAREKNGLSFLTHQSNSVIYAKITWDLFRGLETRRNVELAKNEMVQFKLRQNHQKKKMELQVRSLFNSIKFEQKKLIFTKEIIVSAEHLVEECKRKFNAGEVTEIAVREAEHELQKENCHYLELLYQFHCMLIEFRYIIGSPV